AKPLNISTAPLDPKLRDAIDHLPRRVYDQLKNLGDMVNFVMIGSQKDVQAALQAANWFVADTSNSGAVTKAILMTYENKDYLQMPMSQLYLFGRVQDFGYEQAEPYSVVASRHHFRLWKAPFQVDGQDVWVGAGTHDVGFEKDQRNGSVTHKIDPAVDGERDHIAFPIDCGINFVRDAAVALVFFEADIMSASADPDILTIHLKRSFPEAEMMATCHHRVGLCLLVAKVLHTPK